MATAAPDATLLAERLAAMVRIPTVSPAAEGAYDEASDAVFEQFEGLLREFYPLVFEAAGLDRLERRGLLLRIPGALGDGANDGGAHLPDSADSSGVGGPGITAAGPAMLMAHQDVVPAPGEDEWAWQGWAQPPFAGVIGPDATGATCVFGRGTLDDKGPLLVMLEGVESLLARGWRPAHDLYLHLGGDEETRRASSSAAQRLLRERGARLAFVLDEGGAVASGVVPGMTRAAAMVGIAEKGIAELEIVVEADPQRAGHASTPPRRSVTAALGRAVAAVEAHPHPTELNEVARRTLAALAPHLPTPLRALLERSEKLSKPLSTAMGRLGGELAAMVRTTAVVTRMHNPGATNVMPSRATAHVNMRVALGSSVAQGKAHLERVVRRAVGRGGPRVRVELLSGDEPTGPSPMDGRWEALTAAIAAAYPQAVPVPFTVLATTDSRRIAPIAEAIYRFAPLAMSPAQRASVHGVDERVEVASLAAGVAFYRALLSGPAQAAPPLRA